jgi:hypothetical protein
VRFEEKLEQLVQELSLSRTLDAVMQFVCREARLTDADGTTFVLRDGNMSS